MGDVDNDGDLDAFLANGRNEDVEPNTVWLNDGRGRFRDSSQRLGKMDSYSTALGDLDADGDLDALVGNMPSCETFENDGRGRFIVHQALSAPEDSGAPIWAVALGDLDNDSDLDAFLGGCCGAIISRGGLEATPIAVLSPYNMVWMNDGVGSFRDTGQRLGTLASSAVALGDLDGDGDLDAFVGNIGSIVDTSGTIRRDGPNTVWLNYGTGQFDDSGQLLGNASTYALALGDVDGDGDLDTFVGNGGANEVWLNDGTGHFADSGQNLGDANTRVVVLVDLDGDGDLDAFVDNDIASQI